MKILVVGAGAVGGYFGGVLSRGGEDVVFLARGQNLEAINTQGLRVEGVASGRFTVHPSTMAALRAVKHDAISSMYLDLEAGNPLEVAVLNGAISTTGKETGVATPVNDFITACLIVADNRARSGLASAS